MARPRSEDKQTALLEAATEVVAAQGLGAPTAVIAKRAGVAEGTLFRYFPTKDDLLNELYLHLKWNLTDSMRQKIRPAEPLNELVRALWNGYIDWGIANPVAVKTLNQLAVSDRITAETRTKVAEFLPEVQAISCACVARGPLAALPNAFADSIFMTLADTTMRFAALDPAQADAYKAAGFQVLWQGIER